MKHTKEEILNALHVIKDTCYESYESVVGDMIACPYYCGDERALCVNKDGNEIDCTCFECKENWLNSEVSE